MSHAGSIRTMAGLAACHAVAVLLCLALFLLVSAVGLFGGISILFYRGIAELVVLAPVMLAALLLLLRLPWAAQFLTARDAAAATMVAVSLNLTFFVVGPVTVDRSVSVFMLSQLADAQSPLTAEDLRRGFAERYLDEWDQVGRRIQEQIASGNVERASEDRYRLTAQGASFMQTARFISRVFGGDPRFVGAADVTMCDKHVAPGLREAECRASLRSRRQAGGPPDWLASMPATSDGAASR